MLEPALFREDAMIDKQTALIYTMVLMSAADRHMTDSELGHIGLIVNDLPVFEGFDYDSLPRIAGECAELLQDENGLDRALESIKAALPPSLRETAYAVACDIAAADAAISQEELRLLEMMRDHLEIERLVAAAIERGSRARHATT